MAKKFQLGQSAIILKQGFWHTDKHPWAEGTVSAIGENCVRIRIRGWRGIFGRQRWINQANTEWEVEAVQD